MKVVHVGQQFEQRLRIGLETPLCGRQRPVAETAVRIQHRQQRERDARSAGTRHDAMGELGPVGIGLAVAIVVQVVEFRDRGVAVLQHLDVQVRADRLDVLGLDEAHQPVHLLAPGPEVVGRVAAQLGQARHRALERMRVDVGHAREHEAVGNRMAARGLAGLDTRERAGVVPFEEHVARPARGQQRVGGME